MKHLPVRVRTSGVGLTNPIGRSLRINWPNGLEAQAITAGPNPGGAKILLTRHDGQRFDIKSFPLAFSPTPPAPARLSK